MVPLPEQQARGNIDVLLEAAGWHVCDAAAANIHAGKAAEVIEAEKEGITLTTSPTTPTSLTADIVTPDRIRAVVGTFRDKLKSSPAADCKDC